MYLWRSLAAHHLAMVKAPVQIRLGTLARVDGVDAGAHDTEDVAAAVQTCFNPLLTDDCLGAVEASKTSTRGSNPCVRASSNCGVNGSIAEGVLLVVPRVC